MIYLYLEGRLMTKGRSSLPSSVENGHTDATTSVCMNEAPSPLREVSPTTTWERTLARLRQRVQEVQDLIGEDLHDLEEPLNTLCRNEVLLSPEQTAQLVAARACYKQVFPECCHALERILSPFGVSHEQADCEVQPAESTL